MKKKLKNILITNDDGYNAVGLGILKEIAFKLTDEVFVVSPKLNQSAKSKSITIQKEIDFEKLSDFDWVINGTPTDCIVFALNHLFKENMPELILSGINAGSNIGDEVSYSGTVAAAWEGAVRGINSFALSQYGGSIDPKSYVVSQTYGLEIVSKLINLESKSTKFYNINFPNQIIHKNVVDNSQFTHLASQKKGDELIFNSKNKSFKIGRMLNESYSSLNSDLEIIKNKKISISPLLVNLTDQDFLSKN